MALKTHKTAKERRKTKVSKNVIGTGSRPRVSIFRSNKYNYVQVIDDRKGTVLTSSSSMAFKKSKKKQTKLEDAYKVGEDIAEKLKKLNIKNVVFDRGSYRYHGRVKRIADGIRKKGIKV